MNYSFYTPEQTELLNSFKASGKTFVSCAYRNKGTKSPITLMFEAYSMPSPASADSDPNADFQRRMVSKLSGINYFKRKTLLGNVSEDKFDELFSEFGYTADMVDFADRDDDGNLLALGIMVDGKEVFGEDSTIIQINTLEVEMDDEGNPKNNWQEKKVDGEVLTKDGQPIYMKFIFAPVGSADQRIQQDQVFGAASNSDIQAKVAEVVENKVNSKKQEKVLVESEESDNLEFDF